MSTNAVRTAAARRAFEEKFNSPEERRDYMRELAARGNARRITLSSEEAEALAGAYALIRRVYERHAAKLDALIGEGADDVP